MLNTLLSKGLKIVSKDESLNDVHRHLFKVERYNLNMVLLGPFNPNQRQETIEQIFLPGFKLVSWIQESFSLLGFMDLSPILIKGRERQKPWFWCSSWQWKKMPFHAKVYENAEHSRERSELNSNVWFFSISLGVNRVVMGFTFCFSKLGSMVGLASENFPISPISERF